MQENSNSKRNYIWSKYNFIFIILGKTLLYNSNSNSLVELDSILFDQLAKKDFNLIEDSEIRQFLISNKNFVKSDEDEFNKIKLTRLLNRFRRDVLSLTIAPTLHCNFNCSYCYELSRPAIYMNNETENSIIDFIKKYKGINYLNLTWYGGEPLLSAKTIENLSLRIKSEINIPFDASIITNGYLLTEENILLLTRNNVSTFQITIDGLENTHNIRRPTLNGEKTFYKIIENIECLLKINNSVRIAVRVNIDNTNKDEFITLESFIMERLKSENVTVYPGFVHDSKSCLSPSSCALNVNEQGKFFIDKFKEGFKKFYFYPSHSDKECMARNINSYVIDSSGDVYKCMEVIGRKEKVVFNVNKQNIINDSLLIKYLTGLDPLTDNNCISCGFLPICEGGCPQQRIDEEYYIDKSNYCTEIKEHLKEYIEAHITYKLSKNNKS